MSSRAIRLLEQNQDIKKTADSASRLLGFFVHD